MLRAARVRSHVFRGAVLIAAVGAGFGAGCDDPQRPAMAPDAFDARWDGGALVFAVDGGARPGDLVLIATELEFDPATEVLQARVALHNHSTHAVLGPAAVIVHGFVPASVTPRDATCGAPLPAGECAFDHRGTYGNDGVLAPGEQSAPVAWRLHVPGGRSFGFRARLGDADGGEGEISGVVFADTDRDGSRDAGESGLPGIRVRLAGVGTGDDRRTDALGRYRFPVTGPGLYTVSVQDDDAPPTTTPLPLRIVILRQADGSLGSFTQADIGLARGAPGPRITLEGFAFADLDRDGQRDAGEPGLAGVEVRGIACPRVAAKIAGDDDDDDEFETRTDASGHWVLVLPDCGGPWEVRGGSVEAADRTTPREILFFAPPAPGTALRADFGYAPEDPSSRFEVHGVVFRDDDGDGVRDPSEPPLAGVLVTADGVGCDSPVFASDRTDERGRYQIDGDDVACPLPWQVRRADVPGTEATTPASVILEAPPLFSREFVVDFGVRFVP